MKVKQIKRWAVFLLCLPLLVGCQENQEPQENTKKYAYTCDASNKCSSQFMGPFDTQFQIIAYNESEEDFVQDVAFIDQRFTYYNALFDKYNDYENINNVKTINEQAGLSPVKVDQPLFEMIEAALSDMQRYSSKVNIALGPVLEVWHTYREQNNGTIPTLTQLEEKNQLVDISKVILDKEASTVYLEEKGMSLDVGATAKGYASELVKQELIARGTDNFLISAGGNIISHGKRMVQAKASKLSEYLPACRDYYTIDIMSPKDGAYEDISAIAAVIMDEGSAVTSGDYQRYFVGEDGVYYHHLIDPDTLFPPHYFRSVTIVTEDSGLADFLSSATFLTPLEEGKAMIESLDGVEAIWLLNDGTIAHTSGLIEGENCHFYVEVTE